MAEPRKAPASRASSSAPARGKAPAKGKAPARRRRAATPAAPELGPGYVHSTFGPFASMALVVMPAERAAELVAARELEPAPAFVVDAVRRELEELEKTRPGVSGSALAATALALALELSNPGSSSTSRAMLAARLIEATEKLGAQAPAAPAASRLDELRQRREARKVTA